jgi:hypothetical protein
MFQEHQTTPRISKNSHYLYLTGKLIGWLNTAAKQSDFFVRQKDDTYGELDFSESNLRQLDISFLIISSSEMT